LAEGGAGVDAEDARSMTLEDHRHGFTAAMAALIGDFHAYLDREGADPTADEVSYRQFTLWLGPDERSQLIADISRLLLPLLQNPPGEGREAHMASPILCPTGPRSVA
jgi:hypothetical protein